jgi:hypothetical protein
MESNQNPDPFVPRPMVAREFGRCTRTIQRWEEARIFGFDEPITIRGNVYHKRSKIEAAKAGAACLPPGEAK